MELRHLRYFVAVAELESFTRASEKLFIAQPPLSLQVKQLEEEVGVPLLVRHPRGVKPTPAGVAFMRSAMAILDQVERAKEQARRVDQGIAGVVNLGFVPSASHVVIPALLRELRRKHPDIELQVQEMITADQVDALRSDALDFGLVRPPLQGRSVRVAAAIDDPFCIALPAGHPLASAPAPLAVKALANEPMVGFSRYKAPAFFDQTLHVFLRARLSPLLRYEASPIYTVLDLVGAGLGFAVVPSTCSLLPTEGVRFRRLPASVRSGSLALVTKDGQQTPVHAAVAAITAKVFGQVKARVSRGLR